MTALASERDTKLRPDSPFDHWPVAASTKIYAGGLVALNSSGYLVPASASTTLICVGRAEETVDNTAGANGDLNCRVQRGIMRLANSSSNDAIAATDRFRRCYAVDDQTVAKTDGSGTRPFAGIIYDVDANGVWVIVDDMMPDLVPLVVPLADIGAASSCYVRCPVNGRIISIGSTIAAAIAGADAAMTSAIQPKAGGGFTAITGGSWTVPNASSAAGDSAGATPTGANTVNVGDTIRVTSDGGPSNSVAATITILIAAF